MRTPLLAPTLRYVGVNRLHGENLILRGCLHAPFPHYFAELPACTSYLLRAITCHALFSPVSYPCSAHFFFANHLFPSCSPSVCRVPQPLPPKGSAHGNGLGRYFVADAVEAAAPAVANITVNIRFHAGRWTPTYATQSGSGFVISEDGLVVTNAHVIASSMGGDEPVMITLTDGRKFSGKVSFGLPRSRALGGGHPSVSWQPRSYAP